MNALFKLTRAISNLSAWPEGRKTLRRDRRQTFFNDYGAEHHLRACIQWLARAQDAVANEGGVSAGWHFRFGWLPPFPETTGYIIPSFFDYAFLSGEDEFHTRAIQLAEWEVKIQKPDGSVRTGFGVSEDSTVFDTGQGLFGFLRAYQETKKDLFLDSAHRAGDWLLTMQDDDGAWRRSTFRAVPHSYNARTAWALSLLGNAVGDARFIQAARANLDWVVAQQDEDGWMKHAAFHPSEDPLTHTMAYTTRGLMEGGLILNEPRYIEAAIRLSTPLRSIATQKEYLAGTYGRGFLPDDSFSCLTGNAQFAIIFFILGKETGDQTWTQAALALNAGLRKTQNLESDLPGIHGGIKGSQPVDGAYSPWAMLNWAVKFLLDSLMLEISHEQSKDLKWGRQG